MNYGYIKVSSDKQTVENNIRDGLFEVMMNADATCLMFCYKIRWLSMLLTVSHNVKLLTSSKYQYFCYFCISKDISEKSFIWHHSARIVV